MLEQRQIRIQDLEISEKDIYLAMGYRGNVPDSYVCELIAETYSEIVPLCLPPVYVPDTGSQTDIPAENGNRGYRVYHQEALSVLICKE